MILGDAVYSILSGDSGVTDLVDIRIYPVKAPQKVRYPFVVFSFPSIDPTNQKDGASPIDLSVIEIDIYANSHRTTHSIAAAIRLALDDYSGTAASIVIRRIWYSGMSDGDFLEDHGFFAATQTYQIKVNT